MYRILSMGTREHLQDGLESLFPEETTGMRCDEVSSMANVADFVGNEERYDLVIACLFSHDLRGLCNLQQLRQTYPELLTLALFDPEADRKGALWTIRGLLANLRQAPLSDSAGQADTPAVPSTARSPESGERASNARLQTCRLTPRQFEVLDLLSEGKSNKEIARCLDLSEGTVKVHCMAIFRELGVTNRTQAAMAAGRLIQVSLRQGRLVRAG